MNLFKLPRFLIGLFTLVPAVVVYITILFKRPYYGLMDDASLLMAHAEMRVGPEMFASWLQRAIEDIHSGFFRLLYQPMCWLFYTYYREEPLFLFSINFFLAVFGILILVYSLVTAIWGKTAQLLQNFALATVITFSIPWIYDLFIHPSLQEKLIHIAAALNFLWITRQARDASFLKYMIGSAFLLTIGAMTKAQFVVFFPAILILTYVNENHPKKVKTISTLFITIVLTFILAWIAHHGRYTGGVRFTVENFIHSKLKLMILVCALTGVIASALSWKKQSDEPAERIKKLIPAMTLFSFLAVFFSWNLVGYLVSLIAPVMGVLGAVAVDQLAKKHNKTILVVFLALSTTMSFWRSSLYFQKLADIKTLIMDPKLSQLSAQNPPIYINCLEGKFSFNQYSLLLLPKELRFEELFKRPQEQKKFLVIHDGKLCPADSLISGYAKQALIAPSGNESFQLFEVQAP